jgi:FkbM family methyltransferase
LNWHLLSLRIGKLLLVTRSPGWLHAFLAHGVLAGVEHRYVLSKGFRCIVDIGANRGQFALAARRFCPRAHIISFEPLAQPSAIFRKLFAQDDMVTFHQAAIGPEPGTVPMHVSREDDSSSLLPITGLQEKLFPGTAQERTENIRVGRLADFVAEDQIPTPALLKLDVQGYELEALKGCEDLIGKFSEV